MNMVKIYKLIVLSCALSMTVDVYANENLLRRVTYTASNPGTINIDLGAVRLYFDQQPDIVSAQLDGKAQFSVIIAGTVDKRTLDQINNIRSSLYAVRAQLVKVPKVGIQLLVTYDPSMVVVRHELFQSADMQQGIVLYMYNQKLIESIANKENLLLQIL